MPVDVGEKAGCSRRALPKRAKPSNLQTVVHVIFRPGPPHAPSPQDTYGNETVKAASNAYETVSALCVDLSEAYLLFLYFSIERTSSAVVISTARRGTLFTQCICEFLVANLACWPASYTVKQSKVNSLERGLGRSSEPATAGFVYYEIFQSNQFAWAPAGTTASCS
jgi:hypothetical protein